MKKHLQILILLLISSNIFGQPLSDCGNPVAHDICSQAPSPRLCELDGYTFSTGDFTSEDDPVDALMKNFCGFGTGVHNNMWIGFVADSQNVKFTLEIGSCSNTSICGGLQAAIISTDCQSYVTTLNCVNCVDQTFAIQTGNLEIGQKYYLMVDGCCGDICDFTLHVDYGIESDPVNVIYEFVCDTSMIGIDTAIVTNPDCNCTTTTITHKELNSGDIYIHPFCDNDTKKFRIYMESSSTDSFNIEVNGLNYGNFPYTHPALPNMPSPPTLVDVIENAENYTIIITDRLTGCMKIKELSDFSCGDCQITNLTVTPDKCEDGKAYIDINFDIENGLNNGFYYSFSNSKHVTKYIASYPTATQQINDYLTGFGQSVTLTVKDNFNEACFAELEFTAADCEPECGLGDLIITEDCQGDSLFLTIDFEYTSNSSTFFLYKGQGKEIYSYDQLPLSLYIPPNENVTHIGIVDSIDSFCKTFRTDLNFTGCTNIWPGDVNLDGIVNNLDLIYIGIANNYQGTPRATSSIEWVEQSAALFEQSFENGVNYAHADCNGSGIINDDDIIAISQNYNKTHGEVTPHDYIKGTATDPLLKLDLSELTGWKNGQVVSIPILLGDDAIGINNLYGISFNVVYPEQLFQNGLTLKMDDTWINNSENIVIQTKKNSALEIAITQKDGAGSSGSGVIGRLEGIIDDLTGMPIIEMGFEKVEAMTKKLEILPLRYDTESIMVAAENPLQNQIELYPNPSSNMIIFEAPKLIQNIEILDMLGHTVYQINAKNATETFSTSRLSEGVYFAKISIDGYVYVRKFEVMR